jgi:hypothetical protein
MYSKPDYTTFTVDGMEILISVSPSGKVTAKHNARDENHDDSTKTF